MCPDDVVRLCPLYLLQSELLFNLAGLFFRAPAEEACAGRISLRDSELRMFSFFLGKSGGNSRIQCLLACFDFLGANAKVYTRNAAHAHAFEAP